MGCCKSKRHNEGKKLLPVKGSSSNYYEKESQQKELDEILGEVESQIKLIKTGV